ncbi:ThiF family adenylyltransferase [Kineobactrum salinum]|uniref:THIF-type NAD/FAD binding fold domain-containing protein n=1 Tax=Kineobactrum salinum TaxID=2708301 RepID=A0A6C0U4U9_9GAMM|nr:ThiF family adenylyltransferase [Kineobactrum salinum]QIB67131.1 hypothetical protein G3T16_18735 [Kineobactrum salinum]
MADLSIIRHQSIFDPTKVKVPIHIIGAGATGSRIWLALVELGMTDITVYDFDNVEAHNLANQIYLHDDIGKPKVHALRDYYTRKTGKEPPEGMAFVPRKVDQDNTTFESMPGIVLLLTDSMASRRDIYGALFPPVGVQSATIGLIETRMASSYGNIFTINCLNKKQLMYWAATLPTDERTETTVCGSSISVGPTASVIANLAVWQLINLLTDRNAVEYEISLFLKPLIVNMENPRDYSTAA